MRQARENYRNRDLMWIIANVNSKQRIKREDIYRIPMIDDNQPEIEYPELTAKDRKFAKVAQKLIKVA